MDYANGLQPSRIKLEIRHSHRLCWPRAGPGGGSRQGGEAVGGFRVGRGGRWQGRGRGGNDSSLTLPLPGCPQDDIRSLGKRNQGIWPKGRCGEPGVTGLFDPG